MLTEETIMTMELFVAAGIIVLAVLVAKPLLIMIKGLKSEPDKRVHPVKDRWISWYYSCYQPCMKDPEESSDSCVMRCHW